VPKVWKKRNLHVTADGAVMELVDEPSEEASPKQPRVVQGYQASRVKIKLAELFPGGVPLREQLSDSELVSLVRKAFDNPQDKKTGLAIPDRKTILNAAGRTPRKKTK
jgi:hypothetical protein